MARTGPKRLPEELKKLQGTSQPCRESESAVIHVVCSLERPDWFRKGSIEHKLWDKKVDLFAKRGLDISDCSGSLAQYVALEAELIKMRKKGIDVPTSKINTFRLFASDFYDTPASQQLKAIKGKKTKFGVKNDGPPPPPPGVS